MFSSASLAVDVSTSKMPPQQPDRLLYLFYDFFDFGAHVALFKPRHEIPRQSSLLGDVAVRGAKRNRHAPHRPEFHGA
ncbi:conserved hypothetical protein [Bradyrhizobium sp. ORS 375]|nr:conserved hypothetical protein [Bradyrhizobium sp. ORS 375]